MPEFEPDRAFFSTVELSSNTFTEQDAVVRRSVQLTGLVLRPTATYASRVAADPSAVHLERPFLYGMAHVFVQQAGDSTEFLQEHDEMLAQHVQRALTLLGMRLREPGKYEAVAASPEVLATFRDELKQARLDVRSMVPETLQRGASGARVAFGSFPIPDTLTLISAGQGMTFRVSSERIAALKQRALDIPVGVRLQLGQLVERLFGDAQGPLPGDRRVPFFVVRDEIATPQGAFGGGLMAYLTALRDRSDAQKYHVSASVAYMDAGDTSGQAQYISGTFSNQITYR